MKIKIISSYKRNAYDLKPYKGSGLKIFKAEDGWYVDNEKNKPAETPSVAPDSAYESEFLSYQAAYSWLKRSGLLDTREVKASTTITSSYSIQDLDYWIEEYQVDYSCGKSLGDIWDEVFDATSDEALADDVVTELEDTVEVYDHYYE